MLPGGCRQRGMAASVHKSSCATPYRLVTARGRPGDFRVPACTWGEPADTRDGAYHQRIDFNGTDELSWSKATTNYCVNYCDTTVTLL
jgi:hypothetical protein